VALAWAGARVLRHWLRRRERDTDAVLVDSTVRALRGTVVIVGLYAAAHDLPIAPGVSAFISGALFVLAVLLVARVVIRASSLGLHRYLDHTTEGEERERMRREYLPLASTVITVGVVLIAV